MKNLRKGFTLVEIMIVVLIIGVLLAIAVPNFMNARKTAQTKACVANLKAIQTAKEQILMAGGTAIAATDIFGADKLIKVKPVCPAPGGGDYVIGDKDTDPSCPNVATLPDHKL
ncbi:MAG: competence type IV pilus major pilin ComGC [Armatimonadota bacterium]